MKRGLILVLVFLLSISSVLAFQAEYEPLQNEALPGDSVSYVLHLNNNEENHYTAVIKSTDINWLMDKDPQKYVVRSGDKKDVTLLFNPLGSIPPGRYGIKILIELSESETRLERILAATVVDYKKAVDTRFSSLPVLDPRRTTMVKLNVVNNYNIVLSNLDVEIFSEHFSSKQKLSLDKKEQREIEFPISLTENTLKGDYNLNVKISLGKNSLLEEEFAYTVGEYEDAKQLIEPESGFLISGESVTLKNEGNSPAVQSYSKRFDYLAYKFASFSTEPNSITKDNGAYNVEWSYVLSPKESRVVTYSVNYRLPTFILVLIIVVAALVYVFRKKNAIVINKRVLAMHGHEGNVHVMKVVIGVKNRGNTGISNVRVVDRVPTMIKAPAQFGTMRPNHIKSAPDGTLMVWDINYIRRGEEKIITYRIDGKMQVLGRLVLPSAVAKYKSFGRMLAARSGIASLHERR